MAREISVPQISPDVLRMPEVLEEACGHLHSGRAQKPSILKRDKGAGHVGRMPIHAICNAGGVFKGLARSLREKLQHRMGRISEQDHPVPRPLDDRIAIEQRPTTAAANLFDGLEHIGAGRREVTVQFFCSAPIVAITAVPVALEDSDLILELPTTDRILHEMHFRTGPDE